MTWSQMASHFCYRKSVKDMSEKAITNFVIKHCPWIIKEARALAAEYYNESPQTLSNDHICAYLALYHDYNVIDLSYIVTAVLNMSIEESV